MLESALLPGCGSRRIAPACARHDEGKRNAGGSERVEEAGGQRPSPASLPRHSHFQKEGDLNIDTRLIAQAIYWLVSRGCSTDTKSCP